MEFRAGHLTNGAFVDAPGGQLIHARATDSDIVEHISTAETVKASASRLSTLGDGFVEAIATRQLIDNVECAGQLAQRGTPYAGPSDRSEQPLRFGRFGWKAQQASLLSFAAMLI
jgi:CxxC motif-containing protein (DUF1111 family)